MKIFFEEQSKGNGAFQDTHCNFVLPIDDIFFSMKNETENAPLSTEKFF